MVIKSVAVNTIKPTNASLIATAAKPAAAAAKPAAAATKPAPTPATAAAKPAAVAAKPAAVAAKPAAVAAKPALRPAPKSAAKPAPKPIVTVSRTAKLESSREADLDAPTDLDELLDQFVNAYSGMKQRDAGWHLSMATTVGGSELAAMMGMNPYATLLDVAMSKLGAGKNWDGGSAACWWGVVFEDVTAMVVELDLGGEVKGDEICIQIHPGHRNSPDGYIVARLYRDAEGRVQLWTTDMDPAIPTFRAILLLEFKSPSSRKPTGAIPPQYKPQMWSGLAVSPIARLGLYADAVYRKCALGDLGDTPDYDEEYHARDRGRDGTAAPNWMYPVAWGLIGVYAPRTDAPRWLRLGWRGPEWAAGDPSPERKDADAAIAAWQIHAAYFGVTPSGFDSGEVVDFGDMAPKLFDRALALIEAKRMPIEYLPPCLAEGTRAGAPRGAALHTDADIGRAVERLRTTPPANVPAEHAHHYWLVGVLPWKLLELDYALIERRPGFMAEMLPAIGALHAAVAEARVAPIPVLALRKKIAAMPGGAPKERRPRKDAVSAAQIQELFDDVAVESPAAE
jgi:hypothetical protein